MGTEQTPPRRRGPRPLYTRAQLEEARAAASESPGWWEPARRLRSRKAQQDFIWEAHARAVLADWQEEAVDGRELHWWAGQPPPPHSAWAELGRLRDPELIVAVARLVEAARPGGTKRAAQAIRAFRLQLRAGANGGHGARRPPAEGEPRPGRNGRGGRASGPAPPA